MQIEYVSRICLTAGRTTKNQRNLAVCYRLLRKVVIYHKRMASCVTEVLSYRRSCKRSVITEGGRVRGSGSHDYGIVQCTFLLECLHYAGDRRSLLTYGHINAIYRRSCFICRTLIEDRVYGYCRLSCLAVTDYELTLASAYRNHGVYGFESSLERLGHWLTENHTRCLPLERHLDQFSFYPALAVKRLSKRVHDASHHAFADIQRCNPAGALDGHALLDLVCRTKQDSSDIVLFKVHHYGLDAVLELEEFAGLGLQQAVDPDYSVTDLQDSADFLETEVGVYVLELFEQDFRYFRRSDCI